MAKYAVEFNRVASATLSLGTVGAVSTTALRRGKVYDIMVGSEATPADAALLYVVQRYTAAGTNTPVVPKPLDLANSAFLGQAGENHSVDPTYTAGEVMLSLPLNQRATFRWVAAPDSELVYPATTANGFGIKSTVISTGTPAITSTFLVDEQ